MVIILISLRQKLIKNTGPYYDGLYDDNTLVSEAYVDIQNAKQDIAINDKASKNNFCLKDASGNLNMKITGIRSSNQNDSAVTLGDVKSTFLPRDGSRPMVGNLNMGSYTIRNIKPFVENDNIDQKSEVIDFRFFHTRRGELKMLMNEMAAENLSLDGSDPMTGNLNMNNNLKEPQPSDSNHDAIVNFVNKSITNSNATITNIFNKKLKESHIEPSTNKTAVFAFVMDDIKLWARENRTRNMKYENKDLEVHQLNHLVLNFEISRRVKPGLICGSLWKLAEACRMMNTVLLLKYSQNTLSMQMLTCLAIQ